MIINIFVVLLISLLTFIPILSIKGIAFPSFILLFILFLLLYKRIKINKKVIFIAVASVSMFMILAVFHLVFDNFSFKDFLYIIFPFILIFAIFTLDTVLDDRGVVLLVKGLKIFLIIQLVFCLLEYTNLFNFNERFNSLLFLWQRVNAQKIMPYLEVSYRPFGTMGSPIILANISYIFGKTIQSYNSNKKYYYLSFVIILLSGARMALFAFIGIEILMVILNLFKGKPFKAILSIVLIALIFYLSYDYIPFIRNKVLGVFNGSTSLSDDYSFTYRMKMVKMLFNNIQYLFVGGLSIQSFPDYVDSELILRLLQFGIFGFGTLIFTYLYYLLKNIKKDKTYNCLSVLLFAGFTMLTSVIFTNFIYIIVFAIYFFVCERKLIYENTTCNN